jgi:tetrapyrrole methylase family protein/MazG family protein
MSPIQKKSSKRKQPTKNAARKARPAASSSALQLPGGRVGEWFEKLVAVQARLRAPKGCPWDREQTHETLRTYLIEEAYEVLDAMRAHDDPKFADELGDLLLQVLFHADIAREDGRFDLVDVIRAIHDKMIRRHPHVFGDVSVKNSGEVLKNWDRIKAEERRVAAGAAGSTKPDDQVQAPPSLLDGVGRGLPASMEGFQLTRKAARIGFDWQDAEGVLEKIREECAEISVALAIMNSSSTGALACPDAGRPCARSTPRPSPDPGDQQRVEEEVGDLLFAAVNLARFLKIDPEIALHHANEKFARRFRAMEEMAREGGRELASVPREEMEKLWDLAKEREHRGSRQVVPSSAGVPPAGSGFHGAGQTAGETPALVGKRRGLRP